MTRYDVYTADECFLTGTAAEEIAAIELDTRPIGDGKPGALTQKVIDRFRKLTSETGTPIYG
jgi:branched-chain amino acid aminotransferase